MSSSWRCAISWGNFRTTVAPVNNHDRFDALLSEIAEVLPAGSGVSSDYIGEVMARMAWYAPEEVAQVDLAGTFALQFQRPGLASVPTATVSKAIRALRHSGLVEPGQQARYGKGGRPAAPLRFTHRHVSVGVKLQHAAGHLVGMVVAVCGFDQGVLAVHRHPIDPESSWQGVADNVARAVSHALGELQTAGVPAALLGVGVEVGAHVHNGRVITATNISDGGVGMSVDLANMLADQLKAPIVIVNDANALALWELYQHSHLDTDFVVIAAFDEGTGGALVLDGRLRQGAQGMAMEIGHLEVAGSRPGDVLEVPADTCPCGAVGHVDAVAPPARIRQRLGVDDLAAVRQEPRIGADGKQTGVADAFAIAGSALGRCVSSLITTINPARIVMYLPEELVEASADTAASAYWIALESERARAFSTGATDTVITVRHTNVDEAALLGARAAALCVFDAFVNHARGEDDCARRTN